MSETEPVQLCAICGKRRAETVDHVPPKGIFPKPRPSDLITVPACLLCNSEGSKYDEKFLVYLSLHAGMDQADTRKLFVNHALRTLYHNRRLKNKIMGEAEEVELVTPSGIVAGKGHAVNWDSEAHTKVIERTVRGLYFHHFKEILGDRASVRVMWFGKLNDSLYNKTKFLPQRSIGDGALIYKCMRAEGVIPEWSVWVFQFYNKHWAGAVTQPMKT